MKWNIVLLKKKKNCFFPFIMYQFMTLSVIVSFSTSKKGYDNVGKGELMGKKQNGETDWSHSAIAEGYYFKKIV